MWPHVLEMSRQEDHFSISLKNKLGNKVISHLKQKKDRGKNMPRGIIGKLRTAAMKVIYKTFKAI